jgi:putative transposase
MMLSGGLEFQDMPNNRHQLLRAVNHEESKRGAKPRFTDEQVNGFLKQVEDGMPVDEVCRVGGFSYATFYRWRRFKAASAQLRETMRLHEVELENAKLKKLLAEAHLHIEALKRA